MRSVDLDTMACAAPNGTGIIRVISEGYSAVEVSSDRAILRTMHFYAEDRRAMEEAGALKSGNFDRFLERVNESGRSYELLLQNIWSPGAPWDQAVSLALAIGKELLDGTGAIRVHSGGFAGTIQAFVPNDRLAAFKSGMEAVLGEGKCHVLHIRSQGGCIVADS